MTTAVGSTKLGHPVQAVLKADVFGKCSFAGPLNDWAIGHWVREGNAKLNDISTTFDHGVQKFHHGFTIRVSGSHIRNQARAAL
jgi:hypothetical protein